mmetsp:Transcript_98024/g.302233  ORF Transcript_98024/g.302233 Transcript_98024/m.302233 type:complete len:298 (+) Transcript_98024:3-896(+)
MDCLPPLGSVFGSCPADKFLEHLDGVAAPAQASALLRLANCPPMAPRLERLPPVWKILASCSDDTDCTTNAMQKPTPIPTSNASDSPVLECLRDAPPTEIERRLLIQACPACCAQRLDLLPALPEIFSGCSPDEVMDCLSGVTPIPGWGEKRLLAVACPALIPPKLESLPDLEEVFSGTSAEEVLECLAGLPRGHATGVLRDLQWLSPAPPPGDVPPRPPEAPESCPQEHATGGHTAPCEKAHDAPARLPKMLAKLESTPSMRKPCQQRKLEDVVVMACALQRSTLTVCGQARTARI